MTSAVLEKHIRANAQLVPKISWNLLEQYPEVRAACDEVNPNHINIRKHAAIASINNGAHNFHITYTYFADDYDVALAAIKKDPMELRYVSDRLRDEESIVMEAVRRRGISIHFASDRLRNNIKIAETAINREINSVKYIGAETRKNVQIALLVLKINPAYISFMSDEILNDPEVNKVILTLKTPLLGDMMLNDKHTLLEAVRKNPLNYTKAPLELRECKEVLFAALEKWSQPIPGYTHLFAYIPPCLLHDKEIAIAALKRDGYGLSYFPHFNNDEEVILAALSSHNGIFEFVAKEVRTDRSFVMRAIKHNPRVLWTAVAKQFMNDPTFIDEVLCVNPEYLVYL